MSLIISLFEGGSCSNVARGQSVGLAQAFLIDAPDGEVCYNAEFSLRDVMLGTNLETSLYPDYRVFPNESPPLLQVYSSRDRSCLPPPVVESSGVPQSRNLNQAICQDVTNGFVLYCLDSSDDAGSEPCRNRQNAIQRPVLEPVPLTVTEQIPEKLERIEQALNQILLLDDDEDTSFNTTSS